MASADASESMTEYRDMMEDLLKPPELFSTDFEHVSGIVETPEMSVDDVLDWDDDDAEAARWLQESLGKGDKVGSTVSLSNDNMVVDTMMQTSLAVEMAAPQVPETETAPSRGGGKDKVNNDPARPSRRELAKALLFAQQENKGLMKANDELRKELGNVQLELAIAAHLEMRLKGDVHKAHDDLCRAEREIGTLKMKKAAVESEADGYKAMAHDRDHRINIMSDEREDLLRDIVCLNDKITACKRETDGNGPCCKRSRVEGDDGDTVMTDDTTSEHGIAHSMHALANTSEDATDVPYQVQRQAEIDAARARLPPSLTTARCMPTYEGPTLEAMQFAQPPIPPADNAVDKPGYPLNKATFMCMFNTALVNHVWVYMFRIFCLWVYGRVIPQDQQLLMHKLAIE
ncbi:hypothetical protein C8R44DRAFT_881523 [Mycena epipterygia]|nr:hypothetical protein C8R44DRAFT_881523 [Mycena epipterygia]